MAQLPDYTALGERPTPQPASGVAEYAPPNWRQVGMAGQVVSAGGRDLQEASGMVAAASDQQDQRVALAAANQLKASQLALEQDPTNGFRNIKGNGVIGPQFIQTYQGKFKDAQSEISDGLTNENQKRIFDQHAEVLGLQYQSALLHHQAVETTAFNATTRKDTIDIAMNDIAAHWGDDATYQTNQLLMGQAVVQEGKDRGLTGDALANFVRVGTTKLESKGLLYRATGMLQDGNWKAASDFFGQHEKEFDPQDRMHLAGQIKTATDAQTARASGAEAYKAAVGSAAPSPVPQNFNADTVKPYSPQHINEIVDQVKKPSPYDDLINKWAKAYNISPTELKLRMVAESGGNKDAVSSQGAIGLMQFAPATAKEIGIDPKDPEQSIIGAAILMSKYGGTIGGDMSKVDQMYYGPATPNGSNTKQYVENLRATRQSLYGAATPTLTQAFLEGREGAVIDNAKAAAEKDKPGNAVYADQVVAEARKNWSLQLAGIRGKNQETVSNIMSMFATDTPPKALGDLPPTLQSAYDQLPGETKAAIQARFTKGTKGDGKLDEAGAKIYYGLLGEAGENPEQFVKNDLSQYFGTMPDHMLTSLMGMQKSINSKDVVNQARGANITQAHTTVDDMLKPMGLGKSAKAGGTNAKTTEQFYGRLDEAIQTYHDQNGKWPQQTDVRKIAGSLLLQGKEAGGTFWDSSKQAFQVEPGKFYVPLPSGTEKKALVDTFTKAMGHTPTDAELQQAYTRYKMSGGK
jgi:hypothetical protein